jgi:hypothetical protein
MRWACALLSVLLTGVITRLAESGTSGKFKVFRLWIIHSTPSAVLTAALHMQLHAGHLQVQAVPCAVCRRN